MTESKSAKNQGKPTREPRPKTSATTSTTQLTAEQIRSTLPQPKPAVHAREFEYAETLRPENLLRNHSAEREVLIRRVAYTVAITAAFVVVFVSGWLVGAAVHV